MGWADCGTDSKGRPIGYAFQATCDHPGCNETIDRGLAYACGGMHGNGAGCEGYFCGSHLRMVDRDRYELDQGQLCFKCCEDYGVDKEPQTVKAHEPFYHRKMKKWMAVVSIGVYSLKIFRAKNKKLLAAKIDRWRLNYIASFDADGVDDLEGAE